MPDLIRHPAEVLRKWIRDQPLQQCFDWIPAFAGMTTKNIGLLIFHRFLGFGLYNYEKKRLNKP